MNKTIVKIAYYCCFILAALISYYALGHASDLAYSGRQPIVWLNALAFAAAIALVILAIIIKAKFKI